MVSIPNGSGMLKTLIQKGYDMRTQKEDRNLQVPEIGVEGIPSSPHTKGLNSARHFS